MGKLDDNTSVVMRRSIKAVSGVVALQSPAVVRVIVLR